MVFLGKEKTHACLVEQLPASVRTLVDIDAQRLQTIGRTTVGGSRAVSVLCDLGPARCRDQCGRCGDIEAVRAVAASADDLQQIHPGLHTDGVIPHGSGTACNLIGCFRSGALCGKRGEECRILRGACFAAHNLVHDCVRLIKAQVLFVYNFYDAVFDHECHPFHKKTPLTDSVLSRTNNTYYPRCHLAFMGRPMHFNRIPTYPRQLTYACTLHSTRQRFAFRCTLSGPFDDLFLTWLPPSQALCTGIVAVTPASTVC